MKPTSIIQRLVILLITLMSAIGANAAEAYACYTSSNTTLTFYYDNYRNSHTNTYSLNTGNVEPGWLSSNVTKVVFDSSFAGARPKSTFSWFSGMTNLESIEGMSYLNTSEVTDMRWMFYNCSKLTSLDLSHFDTSIVDYMARMFSGCNSLTTLDLSSFNTSLVDDMSNMFYECRNLQTIYVGSGWNVDGVISSGGMFMRCTSLVGGQGTVYNYTHADKTYAHIDGGTSNPGYFSVPLEAYACYTPSNTTLTFYYDNQRNSRSGTTYDLNTGDNLPGWYEDNTKNYVTKVVFDSSFANALPKTTSVWFYEMKNLESITGLSYLNTSEVTDLSWMFGKCENLTSLDLSHFNTSNVTDMENMFYICTKLTSLDLSSFNTSKVTNMDSMFSMCENLTSLDLSSFNTSKVTKMWGMFHSCLNLQTIYVGDGWSTAAVKSSAAMFNNCINLVGGKGTTYNESNPMDKTYAHIDGGLGNPGYFTDRCPPEAYACYTSSNTTLTFYYDKQRGSRSGTTYDLNTGDTDTGWETDGTNSYVTKVVFDPSFANARPKTTYSWFYGMMNLQTIECLNNLNTSEVTNMAYMFMYCVRLTSLDLSLFNTYNVTSMYCMFDYCSNLTILNLSSFNTSKVTDMKSMFSHCSNLTILNLSSFITSKVTDMQRMFVGCSKLQTIYVGDGWSTAAVASSTEMFDGCTNLVGGKGTKYNDSNPTDKTYARIDGGSSDPGYLIDINLPIAYACYTPSNTTLTFYYDKQRLVRDYQGYTTYILNSGDNAPGWLGTILVTKVVFDPSFANARPTTTNAWFSYQDIININGIEYLNTSEVTDMSWMFYNCVQLTSLDLSSFNTSNVTDMGRMFSECDKLTSLDLSSFNTSNVTMMNFMFAGSESLRAIYVGSGWTTTALTYSDDMFTDCTTKLKGGKGTTWNSSNPTDKTYARIDGGPSNPGYFTYKGSSSVATGIENGQKDAVNGQKDEWYTLDGQKLSGKPMKKGVYIQNGQKRIIK